MSLYTQKQINNDEEKVSKDLREDSILQILDNCLNIRNGFTKNYRLIQDCEKMFQARDTNKSHEEIAKRYSNGEDVDKIIEDYNLKMGFKTFSYNGSKAKFKDTVGETLKNILSYDTDKKIDTVVSICGGSFAGIISEGDIILEHGISHLIFNDLNKTIVGFFKNCKDNIIQLQKEVVKIIVKFKTDLKTILVDEDIHKEYFNHLRKRLIKYETEGLNFSVEASALFYFLSRDSFNGLYRYNIDKNITHEVNIAPGDVKRFNIFVKNINQLQQINKFLHKFEKVTFLTMDCIQLVSMFRDADNVIFDADPIYIDTNQQELTNGKANYGFENKDFNHLYLLEILQGTNYIYFNNSHFRFLEFVENNDCSLTKIYKTCNTDKQEEGETKSFTVEFLISGSTDITFTPILKTKKQA